MTKINIQSPGGASLEDGNLRIKDGLPIDATLQTVSDVAENDSALKISTERIGLDSDSTATTQTTAVIQATDTNSGIAIVPNGTGAITAQVPDGTIVGGNARGTYAVDLQMLRTNSTQVASGSYSFAAGQRNTASGAGSFAIGYSNLASSGNSGVIGWESQASNLYSITFGANNNNSASRGTISGGQGNNASSNYSTISGGQSNTASTNSHATVVGGQSNVSSGAHSISGGNGAVASGQSSIALNQGDSRGFGSVAIGGYAASPLRVYSNFAVGFGTDNEVYGNAALAFGNGVQTNYNGSLGFGSGKFSTVGDAQQSYLTARKFDDLTTGGTTVLSLDGTGTTNLIIPQGNNRVWNVVASWVAVVIGTSGTTTGVNIGDVITQCNLFAFKKIGGISSIVGSVTNVATHNDASMASASMGYSAGGTQELALTFTAPTFAGGGSVSLRIVNKLMLTEVAYA